jgi:NhaA family Na+:H+ antiporter
VGELATFRQALLPVGAAIGGMVVPAFFFIVFNKGTAFQNGWGIPMATDIAFSLGVASILGSKFPQQLKLFLTALAIIDDLGAIIVIALFYGGTIKLTWLLGAAACMGILYLLNVTKKRFNIFYIITGILLWYCVYNSGIHATVAGVLFAFMVPHEDLAKLEHLLHKPVNFIILPLFALANTAIILDVSLVKQMGSTLTAGIFFGLFFGKPIGVVLACKLMVRRRMAMLPEGIKWGHIVAAGILAGIGFTMSIFIASLAFEDQGMLNVSKLTILVSSVLSIFFVMAWMWFINRKNGMSEEISAEPNVQQLA